MSKSLKFTLDEVSLLRAVLFEYYQTAEYMCETEEQIHARLEEKLSELEDKLYT
jgi:hypothetical protein